MKTVRYIASVVLAAAVSACSETNDLPGISPDVAVNGEVRISSFSIEKNHYSLPEETDSVDVALLAADGMTYCFGAAVDNAGIMRRYHLHIPVKADLPDGYYVMTMRQPDGRGVGGRLQVRFADLQLADISIILPGYMLDGSGAQDDPYLIGSDDDFDMFIMNLIDDETNGAGLYFRQTADVVPSDQSIYAPGRGYWGAAFAGNYDGGGHEIRNLYYRGNGREGSDTGFGLFTELRGSASVGNVKFTGVSVSELYNCSGILAGSSSGNIYVSEVSVAGHFGGAAGGYALGGVVGCVASGSLNVSDVVLGAEISGNDDLGGVVGRVSAGTTVTISGVRTPDYHFSVSGHSGVGGIVGNSVGTTTVSDVRLEHKVTGEDSDIRIISGAGSGVGGVVGNVDHGAGAQKYSSIRILCPVGGNSASCVGGLLGRNVSTATVTVSDCRIYSVVSGNSEVGGVVGSVSSGYMGRFSITGGDYSVQVMVDDAEAYVSGNRSVGGFAGKFDGQLSLDGRVMINLPVTGYYSCCGGIFGVLAGASASACDFTVGESSSSGKDRVLKISGKNDVGGLVGRLEQASLTGDASFDFAENGGSVKVPDASRFTPAFSCVVVGETNVGGLVGSATASQIKRLSADASVTGSANVGGIVGNFDEPGEDSRIEDCTFTGTLDISAAVNVGGIAGFYKSVGRGYVTDCVNYADITAADYVGGIIGMLHKERSPTWVSSRTMELKWCVNTGKVSGGKMVAGVVGYAYSASATDGFDSNEELNIDITYCMNSGAVTDSKIGVGGIAGATTARVAIRHCANHGTIYGTGSFHGLGGIAGSMGSDPSGAGLTSTYRNVLLAECCNTGDINSGNSSTQVGGLLGYQEEGNKSDVQDCYNTGRVLPDQKSNTGGIVGCVDHLTNIYRCVNSGKVSHGNATIGTHKSASLFDHGSLYYLDGTGSGWPSATKVSAANFTVEKSFGGLDFSKVWIMGSSGPILRDCPWQ